MPDAPLYSAPNVEAPKFQPWDVLFTSAREEMAVADGKKNSVR